MTTYTLTIDKPSLRALLACVSHPKTRRPELEAIAIDGSKFIATDGHRMLVAEAADRPIVGGPQHVRVIPADAYRTALLWTITHKSLIEIKTSTTTYEIVVGGKSINGKLSATTRFPAWEQVVPGPLDVDGEGAPVVGFNPFYAADLALVGKATGATQDNPPTTRMEVRGKEDPVVWRVTSDQTPIREWTYVLMPVRL